MTEQKLPQLEPGKKLTSSEREALRKDNERMSKQAIIQASEQRQEDVRSGKKPTIVEVTESIKQKLTEKYG